MNPLTVPKTLTEHNPYAIRIKVNSDGNELEYLGHDPEKVSYKYLVSSTKKGMVVTFTPDLYNRFMRNATEVAKINL